MPRLDSKLEAEGAEFLVLGNLLVEAITAHKTYTNMPGYDLVAVDPEYSTIARIQVKSRWATDYDGGFLIRNMDCEFVVFVAHNRGYRYRKKGRLEDDGRRSPEYYVFPVRVLKDAPRTKKWGKLFLRHIPDVEAYKDRWDLIRDYLENPN